jgi:hypothetical protein
LRRLWRKRIRRRKEKRTAIKKMRLILDASGLKGDSGWLPKYEMRSCPFFFVIELVIILSLRKLPPPDVLRHHHV